jgi:Family of unknown function (DUF6491)
MQWQVAAFALALSLGASGPLVADEGGETAAEAAVARPSACISATDHFTWHADNSRTIYVRTRTDDYYRLDIGGGCSGLGNGGTRLGVRSGKTNICAPRDWEVTVTAGGRARRCTVTRITPLTPQEVATIPVKFKP